MVLERVYSQEQIADIVDTLYGLMSRCSVFTFDGPLGAGKTTIIQELLRKFGVVSPVVSPTFSYVSTYENEQGERFFHFDLYRLKTIDDAYALGFDEYLYVSGSWSFIEWPDVIMPLITHRACHVNIDYYGKDARLITIKVVD